MVLDGVRTFLNLRRREQFPLKSITHGIRVLDIKWLFHSVTKDDDIDGGSGGNKTTKKRGSSNHNHNHNHNHNYNHNLSHKRPPKQRKILKSDHEAATVLMQSQMRWLYTRFLIPLLRSSFYITETEFTGKRVLHYRKPVWSSLKRLAIDGLLQQQYTEPKRTKTGIGVASRFGSSRMGPSRLRLLPKKTGVRPIAVLCKRLSGNRNADGSDGRLAVPRKGPESTTVAASLGKVKTAAWFRELSTNTVLREAFDVLTFERNQAPGRFGAGVLGMHEIYPRLLKFLQSFRSRTTTTTGATATTGTYGHSSPRTAHKRDIDPLYFASVDIYRCYDNIDQTHLNHLVNNILSEEEYLIQKHAIVHPFDGTDPKRTSRCRTKKVIGAPGCFTSFPTVVEESATRHSASVLVDGVVNCRIARRGDLLAMVEEHLSSHAVVVRRRFGEQLLVQDKGIPQGSVLSTILCNYYYGDIERQFLQGVFTDSSADGLQKHLIVCMVDDFLLVTAD